VSAVDADTVLRLLEHGARMDTAQVEAAGYALLTLALVGAILALQPFARPALSGVPAAAFFILGATGGALTAGTWSDHHGTVIARGEGVLVAFLGGLGGAAIPAAYGVVMGLEQAALQAALVPTVVVALVVAAGVRAARTGFPNRQRA
jgi:hypothetical protein